MTQILSGLFFAALGAFFAGVTYGQLKGRLTGRTSYFAGKVGNGRVGTFSGALAFAWLSLVCLTVGIVTFGEGAGLLVLQ